jgi:fumarate hydratase, class II
LNSRSFLEPNDLNVFKPVTVHNVLHSCQLPADAGYGFAVNMVDKPEPNREHIADSLAKSLMLVTALNPHIGYDKSVRVGKLALSDNITLKHAAERLGLFSPDDFDRWADPAAMLRPGTNMEGGGD